MIPLWSAAARRRFCGRSRATQILHPTTVPHPFRGEAFPSPIQTCNSRQTSGCPRHGVCAWVFGCLFRFCHPDRSLRSEESLLSFNRDQNNAVIPTGATAPSAVAQWRDRGTISTLRHSEPAGGGRSEGRFCIARFLCDESFFFFVLPAAPATAPVSGSWVSLLCDLCVTVPLGFSLLLTLRTLRLCVIFSSPFSTFNSPLPPSRCHRGHVRQSQTDHPQSCYTFRRTIPNGEGALFCPSKNSR
jgi:hypothetical protein